MKGIFRKECLQYFTSFMGYLFIAVFLLLCGLFFYLVNIVSQNSDIKVFFSTVIPFLVFLVPMLTMRSYAEERKQRTEELLLTAPVTLWDIVLGKFFAAWFLFALPLLFTLSFPVILARYGTCELWVVVVNYLAILLIGGAVIALGLLVSVLSEHQIVAGIVSYCLIIVLFYMEQVAFILGDGFLGGVFRFLALNTHLTKLSYGVLDLVDVAYFTSLILLSLWCAVLVLEEKKNQG